MKNTLLLYLEGIWLDREKLKLSLYSLTMLIMLIGKVKLTFHRFLNSALVVEKCQLHFPAALPLGTH